MFLAGRSCHVRVTAKKHRRTVIWNLKFTCHQAFKRIAADIAWTSRVGALCLVNAPAHLSLDKATKWKTLSLATLQAVYVAKRSMGSTRSPRSTRSTRSISRSTWAAACSSLSSSRNLQVSVGWMITFRGPEDARGLVKDLPHQRWKLRLGEVGRVRRHDL